MRLLYQIQAITILAIFQRLQNIKVLGNAFKLFGCGQHNKCYRNYESTIKRFIISLF